MLNTSVQHSLESVGWTLNSDRMSKRASIQHPSCWFSCHQRHLAGHSAEAEDRADLVHFCPLSLPREVTPGNVGGRQ